MAEVEAFTIEIEQSELDDLAERIDRTRWPVQVGNPDGRYGIPRDFVEDLGSYWRNSYDWRAVETEMNTFDHYRVEIDGIPIHFIRIAGKGPDPTPIVLTHGWPWTFWDLRHLGNRLADPAAYGADPAHSFDVIIPSLPGYGFSVPLQTVGVNCARVAELWVKLMTDVLGFERFAAQGGDWGSWVTAWLGHAHPEHLIGVYLTLPVVPGVGRTSDRFAADEQWMLERQRHTLATEAHLALHSRDPESFSYAMADSPLGLAAWLWQRRRLWCDGDPIEVFGRDDLCTQASLYWFNTSIVSSIRLYAEQIGNPPPLAHDRIPIIEAPTGYGIFPKEIVFVPRTVAEANTDLRRWTLFERGGHFAPAEQPDALADELRTFFTDLT